jgi:hypothetical protein
MGDALQDGNDAPENERKAAQSVERLRGCNIGVYWPIKESPDFAPELLVYLRFAGRL